MKTLLPVILSVMLSFSSYAQKTITMRGMWTRPGVKVVFGDYNIFFTIHDINKAMQFLPDNEKVIFGTTSGLDTGRVYIIELLKADMEYRNSLQRLVQRGVGAFLLMSGRAAIEKKNGKKIHTIEADAGPVIDQNGSNMLSVDFYDPGTHRMIFSGWMDAALYKRDIGFD